MTTFSVVIPTFRETAKVQSLLACLRQVPDASLRVYLVNGNPQDATSDLLASADADPRVTEIEGNPSLFWSGLVNIGLRRVLGQSPASVAVVIMNVDVTFDGDLFTKLADGLDRAGPALLGALCHNGSRVLSSGTRVRSWMLAATVHPFAGVPLSEVPSDGALLPVDYLPARCTVIPMEAVRRGGLTAEDALPHYHADNEYTLRLNRMGYPAFIATQARVRCDVSNTGNSIYHKTPSLRARIQGLASIKSAYNPRFRSRFVRLAYPPYARATALLAYDLKGLIEVLLGGPAVRRLFRSPHRGFSGSGHRHD